MTITALGAKSGAGPENNSKHLQHNFSNGGMYAETQNDGD